MAEDLPADLKCLPLEDSNDLCETCSQISLHSIIDAIPIARYPSGGGCGVPNFYEISIDQPLVFPDVNATKTACALCALIAQQSKEPIDGSLEFAGLVPPIRDSHPRMGFTSEKDEHGIYWDVLKNGDPQWNGLRSTRRHRAKMVNMMEPVNSRTNSRIKDDTYRIYSPWQIAIAADPGSAASKYVSRRPLAAKGSGRSFDSLLKLIKHCNEKHPKCRLGVSGQEILKDVELPTRVIDVGSTDPPQDPKLVVSDGFKGQYVSLSHCWGSQRWVATTKDTLADRLKGFKLDQIPRTYADAILVTRVLGLQYLWIDSFSIVQDDREDWSRESLKMGDIYEKAYCNIAATGAEDGRTGFLNPRKEEQKYVRVPSFGSKYVYFCNQPNSNFKKYVLDARVNTRGWVLQERILSRRTIHFAEDQWYWECGEETVSEDGWQHDTQAQGSGKTLSLRESIDESTMPIGKIFTDGEINLGANDEAKAKQPRNPSAEVLWAQILRSYSNCRLTFASDKMPALSGLANKFSEIRPMKYYFGHWLQERQGLPLSLMWYASKEGGLVMPSENRAPTWSCLKGDGPLGFHDCRGASSLTQIEEIRPKSTSSHQNATSIVLRGLVREAKRAFPNGSGTARKDTFYTMQFMSKTAYGIFTRTLGPAKFDSADIVPVHFHLLLAFEANRGSIVDQLALVLKEIENDEPALTGISTYQRIGIANVNDWNFFREEKYTALRII